MVNRGLCHFSRPSAMLAGHPARLSKAEQLDIISSLQVPLLRGCPLTLTAPRSPKVFYSPAPPHPGPFKLCFSGGEDTGRLLSFGGVGKKKQS